MILQDEPTGLAPELDIVMHDDIIYYDVPPPSFMSITADVGAGPKMLRAF